MKRQLYMPCKLYVDGVFALEVGHFLVSNGGSAYLVQGIRQNRRRRFRRHLDCVRWPVDDIPENAITHSFTWYSRKRRRGVTP